MIPIFEVYCLPIAQKTALTKSAGYMILDQCVIRIDIRHRSNTSFEMSSFRSDRIIGIAVYFRSKWFKPAEGSKRAKCHLFHCIPDHYQLSRLLLSSSFVLSSGLAVYDDEVISGHSYDLILIILISSTRRRSNLDQSNLGHNYLVEVHVPSLKKQKCVLRVEDERTNEQNKT